MIKEVLLVDDDLDDIGLFQEALNGVAPLINFHSVKNGRKALEFLLAAQTITTDLIFLDINMPDVNGWQCLTELKKAPLLKQIPVVMYSTSVTKRDEQRASGLGAIALYRKPERFEALKDLLKTVIKDLA